MKEPARNGEEETGSSSLRGAEGEKSPVVMSASDAVSLAVCSAVEVFEMREKSANESTTL